MGRKPIVVASVTFLVVGLALRFAAPAAAQNRPPRQTQPPAGVQERLKKLREQIAARKLTFEVGDTGVLQHDIQRITGLDLPPTSDLLKQIAHHNKLAAEVL